MNKKMKILIERKYRPISFLTNVLSCNIKAINKVILNNKEAEDAPPTNELRTLECTLADKLDKAKQSNV